ncbi:hypothetical protein ILUMI_03022 [Ignelater luminosus]|uniref:Peptidase S1 domain-containing protein n=1 Tax=Ignelater luminosus TaxID=2038154 RepID=A0A8K0GKB4_IGNLU|nr:hypothetical protein ILUMI_03022 [Ignelater luminosus]
MNENEKPIDVAGSGYTYKANKMVTIMGWGYTIGEVPLPSEIMYEVNIQLYDRDRCKNIIQNAPRLDHNLPNFTENFFCAGPDREDSTVDSCKGDSGGPVVDKNLLIGIVSWGIEDTIIKCGVGFPGVYVSVWKFESWIHNVEEKQNEKIATFKREPSR